MIVRYAILLSIISCVGFHTGLQAAPAKAVVIYSHDFKGSKGADLNTVNNVGQTPLQRARIFDHQQVVQFLEEAAGTPKGVGLGS